MLLLLLTLAPLSAQEAPLNSPEETLIALQEAIIPQNDPIALAYRFYGIESAPTEITAFERGDRDEFWVSDNNGNTTRSLTATLEAVGQYAYFWVESREDVNEDDLQNLANSFDSDIYAQVRDIWGTEPIPGVDGDPRLHVLFARGLGASSAAYFARRHNYPEDILAHSNAREMFFVNLSNIQDVNSEFLRSTLAHEFQHMIRANTTPNEDAWLNEGFSTFTEGYLGYEAAGRYPEAFLTNPDTQLTTFGIAQNRLSEYGAGFLFLTYLYDQFGIEAIKALSENPKNGMFGVNEVTVRFGALTEEEFFSDWVIANLIQDVEMQPSFGYTSRIPLIPVATRQLNGSRMETTRQLAQYATDYYEIDDLEGVSSLDIQVTLPETAPLVQAEPTSGEKFWYSNRGDISHTRLYREFDLTTATAATLTYQIWVALEEEWDYGYVLISDDNGATWQTIQTDSMTTDNGLGNLYGTAGYSFSSWSWIKESVILDAYVGKKVIISFELLTDDAINYAGMVLDDVAIPEIGYFSDFEADNGGWTSEGWVWVTNQIPQQAWVQVVQRLPNDVYVTRWFLPHWETPSIELDPLTESVVIAISPIAPVTTIPTEYTLTIELIGD
ncbi:MAG: immune inhibitor A [bacterium]|nr:immune inhibitor A [bacterium]